jgi:glutathione synthase/RimK-type ligase-like ATP-grasp enzyme
VNSRKVVIFSTSVDVATDAVVAELTHLGVEHCRIDTERFPFDTTITLDFQSTEAPILLLGDVALAPGSVRSVWYRRLRIPTKPVEMNPGVWDFCVRESRSVIVGAALAIDAPAMSPPAAIWRAESKPYQLAVAEKCGFSIPRTLITNCPIQVRAAFQSFGRMIIKPTRSGYVDYGDEQHAVFTSEVLETHLEHVADARWSPSIYQELLEKRCDIRVTVVGNEIFAAEIDSQGDPRAKVDWRRTENPDLPHRRTTLAPDLIEKIKRLVKELGLQFAALDFVHTVRGEFVFLEVNPNGQWLWLDDKLDLGITNAVATWLARSER